MRRDVGASLISTAGLAGVVVRNQHGDEVGRVVDVVARWTGLEYPPVTGLVLKVGRRRAFVAVDQVTAITPDLVTLASARLDLRDFERRAGEVVLIRDVIDHQLVDVDGVRVIRAADLYLARTGTTLHLVGVDVSVRTLLRRLGPARWRRTVAPEQVLDWAAIEPFAEPGRNVALRGASSALARLRPGQLADLLEELGRAQRQVLLSRLPTDLAADAIEEMDDEDAAPLLRDIPVDRAAGILAGMEPDEAVDVLRDLDDTARRDLLAAIPPDRAAHLADLLAFPEHVAGGFMTTALVLAVESETVADVRSRLQRDGGRAVDLDRVIVVDADGALVDEVTLLELFIADPTAVLASLCAPPWPIAVALDAPLGEVVTRFTENRGSSVVVLDAAGRPVGRILADDLVDALVERSGPLWRRFLG